jgi:hypothetical protein
MSAASGKRRHNPAHFLRPSTHHRLQTPTASVQGWRLDGEEAREAREALERGGRCCFVVTPGNRRKQPQVRLIRPGVGALPGIQSRIKRQHQAFSETSRKPPGHRGACQTEWHIRLLAWFVAVACWSRWWRVAR